MGGFAPEHTDMAIKKRKTVPEISDIETEPQGLNIVAKPKQPMPPAQITTLFGDNPTPAQLRQLGPIAQACGDTAADAGFTVGDRVRLLRTSYDHKNPQEQRYRNRVKNRATAITAMCVVCTGSRKLVTECIATQCPLWAFRFGGDPFRGSRK